jgi:hypothetical protein
MFNDCDFCQAIAECGIIHPKSTLESLESLEFNPFEIDEDDRFNSYINDPDLQYFNDMTYLENVSNCRYYTEDSFVKKCHDIGIDNACFSLIQFNIRSIPKNLTHFENYMDTLNYHFTIIGLSETWLNDSNSQCYSLHGYNHVSQCRANRLGGGVSIFVKNSLSFKYRHEFSKNESNIECLFIEISKCDTGFDKDVIMP